MSAHWLAPASLAQAKATGAAATLATHWPAVLAAAATGVAIAMNVGKVPLGACRAWGRARAGESFGAGLDVDEACGQATQRVGNDARRRKTPRPFGLTLKKG